MAQPPTFQPLTPDALGATSKAPVEQWGISLLRVLNTFLSVVAQCLNGSLTIGPNIAGMYYPNTGYFSYATTSKYTSAKQFIPITFTWTASAYKTPNEVRMGLVQRKDGAQITEAIFPVWSYSASTNQITISYMTGLSDSTSYYFTFVAQ